MHLDNKIESFITSSLKWNTNFITKISKLNGLNNSNYKINYLGMDYFLSIKNSQFNTTEIIYYTEVLKLAGDLGISYDVVHLDLETGDLFTHWIDGDSPDYDTLNSKEFINSLCKSLKSFHNIRIDRIKDPFESILTKYKLCLEKNIEFPVDILPILDKASKINDKYKSNKHLGLCHYDLNPSNLIFNEGHTHIIDLEFASMGDIFWDLATLSWMMDESSRENLLLEYFNEAYIESHKEKVNDFLYAVKLWNALWSLLKSMEPFCPYDYAKGAEIILKELA